MELIIREGDKVVPSSDSLYLYPEFEKILKQYGSDDFILKKIIKYIYFTSDPKAVPQKKGYNKKEAHKYAIKNAKLDEKFKVTDEIIAAQNVYKRDKGNDAINYINNVISSLRLANKLCEIIINNKGIDELQDLTDDQITSTSNAIKEVLSLSSKINEAIPKLKENIILLREMEAKEEEIEKEKIRGGDEVLDSHLGTGEIENE